MIFPVDSTEGIPYFLFFYNIFAKKRSANKSVSGKVESNKQLSFLFNNYRGVTVTDFENKRVLYLFQENGLVVFFGKGNHRGGTFAF